MERETQEFERRKLPSSNKPMPAEEVITQVARPGQEERAELASVEKLPETVVMNMQGTKFVVSRERLLSLPESILFGMSSAMAAMPFRQSEVSDSEVMELDFNPSCFEYILNTLKQFDKDLVPIPITNFKAPPPPGLDDYDKQFGRNSRMNVEDGLEEDDTDSVDSLPWLPLSTAEIPLVLLERPALIVLREDLDYFVIGDPKLALNLLAELKEEIGDYITLEEPNRRVFNALRNKNTLDSPEYHLMQMLVLVGLTPDLQWQFRARKYRAAQALSLQITKVKLPENNQMLEHIYSLQKLLLFWRKPAKKCWWDKLFINGVTVHVRRIWTLELSILGLIT